MSSSPSLSCSRPCSPPTRAAAQALFHIQQQYHHIPSSNTHTSIPNTILYSPTSSTPSPPSLSIHHTNPLPFLYDATSTSDPAVTHTTHFPIISLPSTYTSNTPSSSLPSIQQSHTPGLSTSTGPPVYPLLPGAAVVTPLPVTRSTGKFKRRRKRDNDPLADQNLPGVPQRPKRPISAYMIYFQQNFSSIKSELAASGVLFSQQAALGQVGKHASAQFSQLSHEERQPYENIADQDRQRYGREMDNWNIIVRQARQQISTSSSFTGLHTLTINSSCINSNANFSSTTKFPKRPMSAYNLFMKERYVSIAQLHPDESGAAMTKHVAKAWQSLPDIERKIFEDRAAELKLEFHRTHPKQSHSRSHSNSNIENDPLELTSHNNSAAPIPVNNTYAPNYVPTRNRNQRHDSEAMANAAAMTAAQVAAAHQAPFVAFQQPQPPSPQQQLKLQQPQSTPSQTPLNLVAGRSQCSSTITTASSLRSKFPVTQQGFVQGSVGQFYTYNINDPNAIAHPMTVHQHRQPILNAQYYQHQKQFPQYINSNSTSSTHCRFPSWQPRFPSSHSTITDVSNATSSSMLRSLSINLPDNSAPLPSISLSAICPIIYTSESPSLCPSQSTECNQSNLPHIVNSHVTNRASVTPIESELLNLTVPTISVVHPDTSSTVHNDEPQHWFPSNQQLTNYSCYQSPPLTASLPNNRNPIIDQTITKVPTTVTWDTTNDKLLDTPTVMSPILTQLDERHDSSTPLNTPSYSSYLELIAPSNYTNRTTN